MAGINRLGKAPPRPGSLRPPDPNRNRVLDIYSEGTEGDADYMRMVQDIEDAQQSQVGWLFGRGAFDKGDLLYLRDEEEKRRFKEEELRDSERAQFLRLQAVAGPGPGTGRMPAVPPARPQQGDKAPQRSQTNLLAKVVKVKSSRLVPLVKREAAGEAASSAKRLKTDTSPREGDDTPKEESDEDGGLAGLLGDYGSDEEESEGHEEREADDTSMQKAKSSAAVRNGEREADAADSEMAGSRAATDEDDAKGVDDADEPVDYSD